jgi:DNA-binding NtrC family response regulator
MVGAGVLVVDDEAEVLDLMVDTLEGEGYSAVPCPSGRDALSALRAFRFEVIVSDMMMPGLTGLDLLKAVKDAGQDVEVILVSAYAAADIAAEAWARGAAAYLEKPFMPEDLIDAVGRAVQRRALRREGWPLRWRRSGGLLP